MIGFNRLIAATPILGAGYFAYLAWSFTPGVAAPFGQTDNLCSQPQPAYLASICKDLRHDRPFPPSKKTYEAAAAMLLFAGVMWQLGLYLEQAPKPRVSWLRARNRHAGSEKKAA